MRVAAWFVLGLILIDRWLKNLALSHQELPLSSSFGFKLYENSGLIGSLPNPAPNLILLAIALIIVVLIWLAAAAWRQNQTSQFLCLLLIIAGAASNLTDRLLHGSVIDYLQFFTTGYLNLADLMISSGVLGLVYVKQNTISSGGRH